MIILLSDDPERPWIIYAREPQLRLQREATSLKSNRDVDLFYSDCWLGLREDPRVLTSSFPPNNTLNADERSTSTVLYGRF